MNVNTKRVLVLGASVLFILSVLAAPAAAQFMKYPFYGTPYYNSYFDHQSPNYTSGGAKCYPNNYLLYTDGTCKNVWYDGHSGMDYGEVYTPILNAANGTLNYVGWYNTSNHESSYGLSMRVDHGNNYRSLYGHLSAVLYSNGEWVGQGWHIGTAGTTGNSSGPHLHFDLQRKVGSSWYPVDPQGWTGGYTDPWYSASGAASSYIWVGSPVTSWPADYGCTIVDNDATGFTKGCAAGGTCPYWYYATGAGYNNDVRYTYSNGTVADYWAKWTPSLPAWDDYEVYIYVPNNHATTHVARYTINHYNGSKTVVVDQHEPYNKWISLGTYYCPSSGTCYVKVTDATYISGNYTESAGTSRKVGVDAAKWCRR